MGIKVALEHRTSYTFDRLVELLQPTLQRGAGRFVAVVGPSGSGKSSLVRAGLLPRLEHLHSKWVVLPALVPGQQPTRNLAYCVAAAFAARGQPDLCVCYDCRL